MLISVDTDMLRHDVHMPEAWEAQIRRTPARRIAQPQDIAEVVVLLNALDAHG